MSSLNDVAKAAGVSVTTASLVLNGKSKQMRIAQGTAEKILAAARDLSYFPNVSAKILNKAASNSQRLPEVVLLWTSALHPSFMSVYITSAQECFANGELIPMNINIAPKSMRLMQGDAKEYLGYRYNGAILTPFENSDIPLFKSIASTMPTVLLHVPSEGFNNVLVDHYKTGYMAAEIFAEKSMKNVSIMCTENFGYTAEGDLRLQGFFDACGEKNLCSSKYLIPVKSTNLASLRSGYGRSLALSLIEKKQLPDAMFIYDDVAAIAFVSTIMSYGINVPKDIEIITYGSGFLAESLYPTLTTIDYPAYNIAKSSLRLLERQMYEPYSDREIIRVKPDITYRESCPALHS